MKKVLRLVPLLITVLALWVSVGSRYATVASAQSESESSQNMNESDSTETVESSDLLHVLLLGIDTGDLGRVDQGRSDTIVLMTVDQSNEQITLTSIPRDSYVEIPGYGMDKINHAYAFGGAELAVDTVSQWLDIDVSDYVSVNMAGLQEVVDAVGGITVTPPSSFTIDGYTFTEGVPIEIDGYGALAYVRERYTSGGDYERQARQRQVITALIEEAGSLSSLTNFGDVSSALTANIDTSYNPLELLDLFQDYKELSDNVETFQLSGYGEMIGGVYYEIINEGSIHELQAIIKPNA